MSRRALLLAAPALAGLIVVAARLFGFAGEHPLVGYPWHHEDISEIALAETGFADDPADDIAWHADYIDSYNYKYGMTPWLFVDLVSGVGVDRHKVALATYEELSHLHFDDLVSTDQVNATWRRYLTGTLAGLVWASEQGRDGDVAAAQNILGVSLHAIQDFHSHSNWVDDPARRTRTWFETSPAERRALSLFTGSYERSAHRGVRPHGEISIACSVLRGSVAEALSVDVFMDEAMCIGVSPLSNSGICRHWKACQRGTATPVIDAPEFSIPGGIVYMHPAGINLDSTWNARIGGEQRGLFDRAGNWVPGREDELVFEDCARLVWGDHAEGVPAHEIDAMLGIWGDLFPPIRDYVRFISRPRACDTPEEHLFAVSKSLAIEASVQWLRVLDLAMRTAGKEAFWRRVQRTMGSRETEFERYDRFPYQFLSAGPYPPTDTRSREEVYLRVHLETADETDAGTDAKIQLLADGAPAFDLDYLPDVVAFLQYNDFEAGDRQVYTVGPFDGLPPRVTLANRATDADDVVLSIGNALGEGIEGALETIRSIGLGLLAGNADYVGEGRRVWTPEDLAAVGAGEHEWRIRIDGGDEGYYIVHVVVRRTAGGPFSTESTWQVEVDRITCVEESTSDSAGNIPSDSDEPFFFVSLIPLPGESQDATIGPAEDTDTGEQVFLRDGFPARMTYNPITLPSAYGMFAVAVQVWESDLESGVDRRSLRNEFADRLEEPVSRLRSDFIAVTGEAIANAWKLASIRIDAFTRGSRIAVGRVLDQRVDAWIDGGATRSFDLDAARLRTVPVDPAALERLAFESPPLAAYAPVARPRTPVVEPPGRRLPGREPRLPPGAAPAGVTKAPGAAARVPEEERAPEIDSPGAAARVPEKVQPPVVVSPGAVARAATVQAPAPEDCIAYDPARLRIEERGGAWLLLSGDQALQPLATRADAETALAAARGHTRTCFAGRDGRGLQRVVFSWLDGGSGAAAPVPRADCVPYQADALRVEALETRWVVTDGASSIAALATRPDAERVALALRDRSRVCYVGRDNTRADRQRYILIYLE